MSDIVQEPAASLVHHLAEAASAVLSQIAGTTLEARPVALGTAIDAATLIRIDLTGALQGVCEIALSAPMSAHFAALLTGETADPAAEINSDTREAAAELIQQICGNAADRLRRAFGPLELKPHLAERDPQANPNTGERQLFVITREDAALEFELHILRLVPEPKLSAEPRPSTQPEAAQPEAVSQPGSQTTSQPNTQPSSAAALTSQSSNRNLDLLLDIELGVTLRFGSRQMLLQDIIELCSGSVVELDRRVEQPVDLLIDGHLIAQGEVVIVEGNYGLRVTQVAGQSEKIACLPFA
jgi:flagellar motor switch protein FliN/FliY